MALKRVGALWKKTDKKSREYLSGALDLGALGEARIMVFQNDKQEENYPDYVVSLVTDDPDKEKPE